MPFGVTVAWHVFQCKLDQCFGMIKQVIVIADDFMTVGKQQNHRDHDVVLTTLLETAGKCNVSLDFDKLQSKKTEVDSLVKHTPQVEASLPKLKYLLLITCQFQLVRSKSNHSFKWSIICPNSQ